MMPLKDLLIHHNKYHDSFVIENFITARAGLTDYGMFKQAIRELYKRFRGLQGVYCQRDNLHLDLEREREKQISDNYKNRKRMIRIREKMYALEVTQRAIKDTETEFCHFYNQASQLYEKVKPLTQKRIKEFEENFWYTYTKMEAAKDYLSESHISSGTIEQILSLPLSMRAELLEECKNADAITDWAIKFQPTQVTPLNGTKIDVSRLVGALQLELAE